MSTSQPDAVDNDLPHTDAEPEQDISQPIVGSRMTPPVAERDRFLSGDSGETARWAQCTIIASPRQRSRSEMQQAYEDFKQRFHNSAEQLLQDQRCHKKRSRMQAYLQQVFGHHNGIWDYLETGVMPPLSPATPPLALRQRVLIAERKRHRSDLMGPC